VAVSAGGAHTYVVTPVVGVKRRRHDGSDTLEDGTSTARTTPVGVIGFTAQ
jgi:hypothetical protein